MRDDHDPNRMNAPERINNTDRTTVVNRRVDEKPSVWRWLLPLLLLLLLGLGLLWYLMSRDTDTTDNARTNTGTNDTSETADTQDSTATGSITDLNQLTGASDPSSLIGKTVSLSGVTVLEVIDDRTFTVGSGGDKVYAILSDQLDSGQAEQAVTVTAGEARTIRGTIVKAPVDSTMEGSQLTQEQLQELTDQGFYISVDQTSVVNAGSTTAPSPDTPTGSGTE